jgi:hypothetical protein
MLQSARTDRSSPDDPTDARRPVSYYVTILTLMLAAVLGIVVAKVKAEAAA